MTESITAMAADFHFLRPAWLLLLPLAATLFRLLRNRHSAAQIWRGLIAPHLLSHLTLNRPRGWRLEPRATLALGLAFAAVALAGPAWEREPPPFVEDRAPLVIALDLGLTMNAVDIQPSRLIRAKQKIRDLMNLRKGSRTALVVYAGSAHTVLPMTDDATILASYVDILASEIMPRQGKQTAMALKLATELIGKETIPGSVVLMTDGIDAPLTDASREPLGNLLIWTFGSELGGPIPIAAGRFATANDGSRLISRLDRSALARFAEANNAGLVDVSLDDQDVVEIQRRVQSHLVSTLSDGATVRWIDAGYWLCWPILLLAALSFRRGWTVRW